MQSPQSLGRGSALSALLLALFITGARAAGEDPIVSVAGGQIRGRMLEEGRGAVFRGVPFAQPPVGALRWREPLPVTAWDGVRDASKSGPPAAQPALGWNDAAAKASSEDCLYLDVWTPTPKEGAGLPVMVWIHGGANVAGAGGFDPLYDGRSFISHGIVLVVVEYRLGVFGFFSHPELTRESAHHASGNYGLMDQVASLQWVRGNIARFGGDPSNVTIFGQSAGSMDVLALMASPLAHGLFNRAIAESGPSRYLPAAPTLAETEAAGVAVAGKLGAPATGALGFLRAIPTESLLHSAPWMLALSADGWVLPSSPAKAFAQGAEARVSLIIGSNAIEFPENGSTADLRKSMENILGAAAPRAFELYGVAGDTPSLPADPLYGNAADQWGTDRFGCPAVVQGEWHDAAGNTTWEYQFDRPIPPNARTSHSGELSYVFGNLSTTGSQPGQFQDADRRLSATIQAYWTNFAKTGNPNGPELPFWPAYDAKARKYLSFTTSADVTVAENQRGPFCDLFREAMGRSSAQP